MFGQAIRIASRPAAAAAAAAALQGPAHARAPPAQTQAAARAVAPHAPSKIVDRDTDGWVMAEVEDQVVVFQPYSAQEVDEAASTVMALWGGSGRISEPGDEGGAADGPSSSGSSFSGSAGDGALADSIIEAAAAASADAVAGGRSQDRSQLEALMAITTKMLRRPGMQREVVACMLEDVEVRELMLRQCSDLDRYLVTAGIAVNPPLLTAPEGEPGTPTGGASSGASAAPGGPDLVSRVVGAVAGAFERAGDALASLGSWLRGRLAALMGPQGGEGEQEEAEARAELREGVEEIVAPAGAGGRKAGAGGAAPKRSTSQVLGGVMVLALTLVAVMVIRRPLVIARIARRA
ncbi:hypothetical protein HYH03_014662 [Edaphochlamys debaryana]|uniref:Uncharacterized protein n=1 Tax=Edaphochlamys debaryana TaxID=47281 RepID=A0A835XMR4_9CHLO|nr:hypothetical protein HYH03_014662 [Edaphochlamys debaryana]|eukprot:KAG2486736.1 hypothetical protein HYH03_014662 [Edaphochlamys debaryana]